MDAGSGVGGGEVPEGEEGGAFVHGAAGVGRGHRPAVGARPWGGVFDVVVAGHVLGDEGDGVGARAREEEGSGEADHAGAGGGQCGWRYGRGGAYPTTTTFCCSGIGNSSWGKRYIVRGGINRRSGE